MNGGTSGRRDWLVAARERRGLSQEQLAALLHVTDGAVSHWEVGRAVPGGPARALLCLHLGLSRDEVDRGLADGEAAIEEMAS